MADVTGADLVVDSLKREGIDTVYTLPRRSCWTYRKRLCPRPDCALFRYDTNKRRQWPRRLTPTSLVVSESV